MVACGWILKQISSPLQRRAGLPTMHLRQGQRKDLVSLRRRRQENCESRTQSEPHKSFNPMLQFLVCYSTNTGDLLYDRHSVGSGSIAGTESEMTSDSTDLSQAGEMER